MVLELILKEMDRMTHVQRIKRHLEDYGKITSLEAIEEYGNTRLSSTIHVLRHSYLMNIKSIPAKGVNRYGKPTHFVTYVLVKENN